MTWFNWLAEATCDHVQLDDSEFMDFAPPSIAAHVAAEWGMW
jgi:hypothetical protein